MSTKGRPIEFTPCGSGNISYESGNPILQLGLQAHKLEDKMIPAKHLGRFDYYLLRIASTFGRNKMTITRGRVNIKLKAPDGLVVAHDLYPRREDEIKESEVEIGLDAGLTWGAVSMTPTVTYKTKIRRIDTYLVAGGLLTSSPWWRFETRRGAKLILGVMETLLTVQASHKNPVLGQARLTGFSSGWLSKIKPQVTFGFRID